MGTRRAVGVEATPPEKTGDGAVPALMLRRQAIPGVRLCVTCQAEHDRENAAFTGYNRRGSKDSQLR